MANLATAAVIRTTLGGSDAQNIIASLLTGVQWNETPLTFSFPDAIEDWVDPDNAAVPRLSLITISPKMAAE